MSYSRCGNSEPVRHSDFDILGHIGKGEDVCENEATTYRNFQDWHSAL